MPKITESTGASNAAADAEVEDDGARIDVQEPIPGQEPAEQGTDYSAFTVKELVAEIERRNADGADLATTGNKPDLVARLVADDEGEGE
jgi:hypothetical protein